MNINAFVSYIIKLTSLERHSNKIEQLLSSENLLLIIIYLSLIFLIFFISLYKIFKNKPLLINRITEFNYKQKN